LISLEELREPRRDRDGRREPTAREVFGMLRRIRDGEPYDEVVGGFSSDFDWGSSVTGRRRRSPYRAEAEPVMFTAVRQLERHLAHDPEIVDRARADLVAEAQKHMDTYGYTSANISWEMSQPSDPLGIYLMRLDMQMMPRTDGEWPAIRQALAEDEADRAEAAAGRTVVNDRLDALRAAAAAWSSSSLRDTGRAAGKASAGFSAMGEALRKTDLRPSDRR
jgi:hypothetical protein